LNNPCHHPITTTTPLLLVRSKKFGWDWFMWNLLFAATPPLILWYGLSNARVAMKEKVKTVQQEELMALAAAEVREWEDRGGAGGGGG